MRLLYNTIKIHYAKMCSAHCFRAPKNNNSRKNIFLVVEEHSSAARATFLPDLCFENCLPQAQCLGILREILLRKFAQNETEYRTATLNNESWRRRQAWVKIVKLHFRHGTYLHIKQNAKRENVWSLLKTEFTVINRITVPTDVWITLPANQILSFSN